MDRSRPPLRAPILKVIQLPIKRIIDGRMT